jgi:hypothetical protein
MSHHPRPAPASLPAIASFAALLASSLSHDAAWHAQETLTLGDQPCPVAAQEVIGGVDISAVQRKILVLGSTQVILDREFKGQGKASVQMSSLTYRLDEELASEIHGSTDYLARRAEEFTFDSHDYMLFLVPSLLEMPETIDESTFRGGAIAANAWLYRVQDGVVLCGALVDAGSSDVVETSHRTGEDADTRELFAGVSQNADLMQNAAVTAWSRMAAVESSTEAATAP